MPATNNEESDHNYNAHLFYVYDLTLLPLITPNAPTARTHIHYLATNTGATTTTSSVASDP